MATITKQSVHGSRRKRAVRELHHFAHKGFNRFDRAIRSRRVYWLCMAVGR